jgi:hypothetical protein
MADKTGKAGENITGLVLFPAPDMQQACHKQGQENDTAKRVGEITRERGGYCCQQQQGNNQQACIDFPHGSEYTPDMLV